MVNLLVGGKGFNLFGTTNKIGSTWFSHCHYSGLPQVVDMSFTFFGIKVHFMHVQVYGDQGTMPL